MHKNLTDILETLTLTDVKNTTEAILRLYEKQGFSIVHFLYFATIVLNKIDTEEIASEKQKAFIGALKSWDFLLPDGIALRLLCKKQFKRELPNLNGTDFLPYILSHLPKDTDTEILLYGATDTVVQKAATYIKDTFSHPVISTQNGFNEFDWSQIPPRKMRGTRILLVGRGSPLQEIWTERNKAMIQEMGCLVFTVGGLLDFWSGAEKRAPGWMRSLKIEWLYRALSNPKKNLRKTLVSLQLLMYLIKK